jgi:sugar phosphate isomerase/epimerase
MQAHPKASLPTIGTALYLPQLPSFLDWLAEGQRDLELQDPCLPHYLDHDWRAEAEAGRDLLFKAGYHGRLGIHAAYEGMELYVQDRKMQAVIRERFLESLAFGRVLGATQMVIHSPFIAFGSATVNYTPRARRQHIIDTAHAILEPVLLVAEQMGCTLVIECIRDKSTVPLLDLVQSFGSDYVRLSIDTGHAAIMERDGGTPPQQWVEEAGDLLAHVHVQDVDGHDDRHWAVGNGNINWNAFFTSLRALRHSPRLVLELDDPEAILPSIAELARLGLAR